MKIIFTILLILSVLFLSYYYMWPIIISTYEWVIDFIKIVISSITYIFLAIILTMIGLAFTKHKKAIFRYFSECYEGIKLGYYLNKFENFKKKYGNEVGRCAALYSNSKIASNGSPEIRLLQKILLISGQYQRYNDIKLRLESFGLKSNDMSLESLGVGLMSFGFICESTSTTYENLSVVIWKALKKDKVVILPVNNYRLSNPHLSHISGNFDDLIIITGMKVSYSGDLILCYIHHTNKDNNVQMVEEVYIPSFCGNDFLCISL